MILKDLIHKMKKSLERNIALKKLFSEKSHDKTLFLDMTEYHYHDNGTGISRVTKKISYYLEHSDLSYKITEVYAKPDGIGFYSLNDDKPVSVCEGDIFFGLDLSLYHIVLNKLFLDKMHAAGVKIYFFIHDMIPVNFSETCEEGIKNQFPSWLLTVIKYDGIIGNSNSTISDLRSWIMKNHPENLSTLKLSYIHLGCDFVNKAVNNQKTSEIPELLMVSTVEPRKKYDLAVQALTILWDKGLDIRLNIVGRKGWNNEKTFRLIEDNKYLNTKLFWYYQGISDSELSELYESCSGVLFTTVAEGFGLAVIEAASYGKPCILRDIPVFREIAGDNAFYFNTNNPYELASSIEKWLSLYEKNEISSPEIKTYTWKESSDEIIQILNLDK